MIGAVTKGNANKYTIDAKDLQFQVSHTTDCTCVKLFYTIFTIIIVSSEKIPDMILPMYEAQLREVCTMVYIMSFGVCSLSLSLSLPTP